MEVKSKQAKALPVLPNVDQQASQKGEKDKMTPLDYEQMQVKEKDFESSLAVVTSIAVGFMIVVFAIVWSVWK